MLSPTFFSHYNAFKFGKPGIIEKALGQSGLSFAIAFELVDFYLLTD